MKTTSFRLTEEMYNEFIRKFPRDGDRSALLRKVVEFLIGKGKDNGATARRADRKV